MTRTVKKRSKIARAFAERINMLKVNMKKQNSDFFCIPYNIFGTTKIRFLCMIIAVGSAPLVLKPIKISDIGTFSFGYILICYIVGSFHVFLITLGSLSKLFFK